MRFHSLTPPHTRCNPDYTACAYAQKALKFARMMTARGHEVYTYGVAGTRTASTEDVEVVSDATYHSVYGDHDFHSQFFRYDMADPVYQEYHRRAVAEIRARAQPGDFLLPWWGAGNRPVCDDLPDLITVEPGIGYAGGHWARWKIFESYAMLHAYQGLTGVGQCRADWYQAVIPNFFDPQDFDADLPRDDYWLFLGRVYEGKGIHTAIQATERAGVRLIVAGQGSLRDSGYSHTPDHVTEIGYADTQRRRVLMGRAQGAIVASMYVEPFGGVQIENLLSGTPTLTTDWGAFAENNLPGRTGYRCRTMGEFVWGIQNIDQIDRGYCREYAERNFSLDAVAPRYEEYFQHVLAVHQGQGWYTPADHAPIIPQRWL